MRPSRYFLLLLALTGLSGSRVLSLETAVESAPRAKAARDSHGVHTAAAAALDASGLDASSQQGGGDGRRELDVAARVAARWPKPSGRKQPVATAASDGGEADDASSRGSWGFDRSAGGEGGGDARARGWQSGVRKPRQSETATFFNSLDENSDGVLAENEIREFVGYVGGSSLDDNSEILGGVSTVMGRLDTDSDKGIGLKELSSWINRLGPMLTVEEAADWVSHAVQLPREVAEAFRSNSISAYDFPELVEDNGAGLYDLGIKRKFRKRIVKAIEVRLLGLGDEPPLPVLHPPSYLGGGKVRIEWSARGVRDAGDGAPDGEGGSPAAAAAAAAAASAGGPAAYDNDDDAPREGDGVGDHSSAMLLPPPPPPPPPAVSSPSRAATFPVHKYVLQRSCPHSYAAASFEGGAGGAAAAENRGTGGGGGGFVEGNSGGGGWVTVHEADDVASVSGSSSFVFVDSGLSPGKTYVYRVRAWNLIGHSEAPTAHVTTPPVHSLWTKPWRLISPWWPTGNSSAASSSSTASPAASGLQEPEGMGGSSSVARTAGPAEAGFVDRGGLGGTTAEEGGQPSGWGWRDVFGATWSVLSWGGWAVMAVVKVLHAMLALAMLQANLTRLRAAYGHGGTGAAVRRNWAAALVWKLNHLFTSNTVISAVVRSLNEKLERVIGLPPVTPPSAGGQGLRRQNRTRSFRTVGGGGGGGGSETGRRRGRFDSLPAGSGRDDWGGGRGGLSRIDEQDYSGLGVGDYGRRRDSNSSRRWRGGYPPAGDGRSPPSTSGRSRLSSSSPSVLARQRHQDEEARRRQSDRRLRGPPARCYGEEESRGGRGVRSAEPSPELNRYGIRGGAYVRDADGAGLQPQPQQQQPQQQQQQHTRSMSSSSRQEGVPHSSNGSLGSSASSLTSLSSLRRRPPLSPHAHSGTHAVVDDEESEPWYCDRSTERSATGTGAASPVNPPPVERKRWFGWGKGVPAEGGSVGEGAIDAGPRAGMPAGEEGDRLRGSGDEVESFDGYGDDAQELSDGGISDGFPWDGDSAEDVGEVEMRPSLERSGSSLDLRRALPHFRSVSVGRLALGLKKGEPSGRDGWRKEFHAAGACFSCRKPFKTITRQRHHCNRCHRVFCAKHGYTAHLKGTVCTIPGGCICDVCLESVVGVEGDGATHEARTTQQRRLFKADSEGGAASVMSTGSEGGGSANGRRFGWGRSTSFGGQLRRRRRAAPSDQSASEKKDDDEGPFSETVTGAEDDGLGGGGGATDRDYDPPPNSARSKAAKRSAVPVSSSETPLRIASVRALTASPSADGSSPAAAAGDGGGRGSAESFSLDPRRVGRGVFGTRRRITR